MERPHKGKVNITENINSIILEIPPQRNCFLIIFMTGWLGGWLMGELFALTMVLGGLFGSGESNPASFFIFFWLIAWTAGGFMAIRTWLWMIAGKVIVSINRNSLTIKKRAALFSPTKTYDINEVKDFSIVANYEPDSFFSKNRNNKSFNIDANGVFKFDYGLKTIKFGSGVHESEAKFILNKLIDQGFITSERKSEDWNT